MQQLTDEWHDARQQHKDSVGEDRELPNLPSLPTADVNQTDNSEPSAPTPPVTRRSTRTRKPFDQYGFDKEYGHKAWKVQRDRDLDTNGRKQVFQAPKIFEPRSYKEAMKCLDWWKCLIAVDEELCALIANGTWEYCKRSKGN